MSVFCGNIHIPWILSAFCLFYLSHFTYLVKVTGAPPLQILSANDPPPLLAVLLQGIGGPPPPPSAVCAYAPLISALLPRQFDTPLQPSNVPSPLPHISDLTFQTLDLNPPPLPSVSFQGRGGPLLLPSVFHARDPFITALCI